MRSRKWIRGVAPQLTCYCTILGVGIRTSIFFFDLLALRFSASMSDFFFFPSLFVHYLDFSVVLASYTVG